MAPKKAGGQTEITEEVSEPSNAALSGGGGDDGGGDDDTSRRTSPEPRNEPDDAPSTSGGDPAPRARARAGAGAAADMRPTFVRPLVFVSYNINRLGDKSSVLRLVPSVLDVLLGGSYFGLSTLPDVITLQEVARSHENKTRREELLVGMEKAGYSWAASGELVTLWRTDTMERVATDAHRPDFVWNRISMNSALDGNKNLQQMMSIVLAEMHEKDQEKFFRYPPITVVLRRTATDTLYVVTNLHTPGDPTHSVQLNREVRWLMQEDVYDAVMAHMVKDRKLNLGLFSKDAKTDSTAAHIMIGDWNTQMFRKEKLAEAVLEGRYALAGRMATREDMSQPARWMCAHSSVHRLELPCGKVTDDTYSGPDACLLHIKVRATASCSQKMQTLAFGR